MSIVSGVGLGSGLDIKELVQQLVKIEGTPAANAILRRENHANVRLSALGRLQASLSKFGAAVNELNKETTFTQYTAKSSNESLLTVQAGNQAVPGQYEIEISNVATRHKLISQGYSSSADAVGKGTLSLAMGSQSFLIDIDDTNNTLAGLRDAINNAQDNPGVQASIIQVDDGLGGKESRLVLSGRDTGSVNRLVITATEDPLAPGLVDFTYDPDGAGITNLTEQTQARDALILVDGQSVTSASNSIKHVIEGITLDLNAEAPGTVVTLNVIVDESSIREKVSQFVSSYNELMTQINSLQRGNSDGGSGPLAGDSVLRNITNQIRSVITQPVEGVADEVNSLAMIGIAIDRYGVMSLNTSVFTSALANHPTGVKALFSSAGGVAAGLDERVSPYLASGGMIEQQTSSLDRQLNRVANERENLAKRLEQVEARLMKQFIAMDSIVGQLHSISNYLTQNLLNVNR